MKVTLESTDILTRIDHVPVRLWEGVTEQGVRCRFFVHRVAVAEGQEATVFDQELKEQHPPGRYLPLTLIL